MGVDITSSMLDIDKKRLGKQGKLVEADVYDMDLQETFDIDISNGGVWEINQRDDQADLGSHTKDIDQEIKGLLILLYTSVKTGYYY